MRWLIFILIVAAVLMAVLLAAVLSRENGAGAAYSGGFDDDNDEIHYKILTADPNNPLPSDAAITDPRKLQSIKYTDKIVGMDIAITYRQCYAPPESGRQISTLFNKGDPSDKARLAQLLALVPGVDPYDRRTYKMSDAEIYRKIRPRPGPMGPERATRHAITIYRLLRRTLGAALPATPAYLDIGCMDGSITAELARLIGAPAPKCIEPEPRGAAKGVEVITETARYPFEDGQFDIITAIMSLHHIPNLDAAVAEIVRVLKPGGYLFLKEHDVWTPACCALVDIEHAIHMTISGEIKPGSLPPPDYYIQYRNYVEFDKMFSALKYVKSNYFHSTERYNISPTRAYWAVYQKPLAAAT